MKKIFTMACLLASTFFISTNFLNSRPNGAPAGYSGSPADGQNCSNCHGGTATIATSGLTTNVPTAGYVPGSTYTITVSLTGSGQKGFQVSPQNINGTIMGSLASGTGSQIMGSKYITHTAPKSSNPGTWTFSWTAPAKGAGTVSFYGAFVKGYSNISTQMIAVNEATSTATNDINSETTNITVFPNPVVDFVNLDFILTKNNQVNAHLFSIDGKTNQEIYNQELAAGNHHLNINTIDLKSGVYLLRVLVGNNASFKKIIIE